MNFITRQQLRIAKRRYHQRLMKKLKRRLSEQDWQNHCYAIERRLKGFGKLGVQLQNLKTV